MPEECSQTGCCDGDVASITVDDCGSAICSNSILRDGSSCTFLPLNYDVNVCSYYRTVYEGKDEAFSYTYSDSNAEEDDFCFNDGVETFEWGYSERTVGCVTGPRTEEGNQLLGSCPAGVAWETETIEDEGRTEDSYYKITKYTALGGKVRFSIFRTIQLFGPIDLEAVVLGCALENGLDRSSVVDEKGKALSSAAVPVGDINLIGRSASAGTRIKGTAVRPYHIVETETTGHCPTTTEVSCESFLTPVGQVDCITISPAASTSVSVLSGPC
jgi:hypothetical protein